MALLTKQDSNLLWLNVAKGGLQDTKNNQNYNGYRGVIEGIRLFQDSFQGAPVTKLQLLMYDPSDPSTPRIVISGTLFGPDKSVTAWARMLVQRLACKENNLEKDTTIEFSFYSMGDRGATGVAAYKPGNADPLKYLDAEKDNPLRCRALVEEWIQLLIDKYGSWGRSNEQTTHAATSLDNDIPEDGLPF